MAKSQPVNASRRKSRRHRQPNWHARGSRRPAAVCPAVCQRRFAAPRASCHTQTVRLRRGRTPRAKRQQCDAADHRLCYGAGRQSFAASGHQVAIALGCGHGYVLQELLEGFCFDPTSGFSFASPAPLHLRAFPCRCRPVASGKVAGTERPRCLARTSGFATALLAFFSRPRVCYTNTATP